MKRFIIGFGWLVAACVAVAGTGTSNEFRLDTRTGVRTAAGTEKIQYSTAWATNLTAAQQGQAKAMVKVNPCLKTPPKYLVVDMSGGRSAARWPISYLDEVPSSGWTDEYKTEKLVLRYIPAGSFIMGGRATDYPGAINTNLHMVTLTKPFYIGVFECTQRQWELAMGTRPSFFTNETCYATRPVEQVSTDMIRGDVAGRNWPKNHMVDADSYIGVLRGKTGLPMIDLPTEAQWECACRAGTPTAMNSGKNLPGVGQSDVADEVARYAFNSGWVANGKKLTAAFTNATTTVGTAKVGTYLPNAWGLYDMHGNVWELCLDVWVKDRLLVESVDPVGFDEALVSRVPRGGSYVHPNNTRGVFELCSGYREETKNVATTSHDTGFRVCLHDATVYLSADSATVLVNATGASAADWMPTRVGTYQLTHEVQMDGVTVGAMESALFKVEGPELKIVPMGEPTNGVEIAIEGAGDWTVYYTTDGNTPTAGSTRYEGPFALEESATVKAVAISPSGVMSEVASKELALHPALAVEDTAARQRWPWNGKVDIDCEVTGDSAKKYRVSFAVSDEVGGTNLPINCVINDAAPDITNRVFVVGPGKYRFVWDAAADLPRGTKFGGVAVSVDAAECPLAGWKRQVVISTDGYAGNETLTDVPVLVRLSSAIEGFDYADFAAPDTGADMIFTDMEGTARYPYEIDEWHQNGESLVWVKLPQLKKGTKFKLVYGREGAGNGSSMHGRELDETAAKHEVWREYAGVWHMNEDSGTAFDSTEHGLDGLPSCGTNKLADVSQMVAYESGACGRARVNGNLNGKGGNYLTVPASRCFACDGTLLIDGWFRVEKLIQLTSETDYDDPRLLSQKQLFSKQNEGFELNFENDPGCLMVRSITNSYASAVGSSALKSWIKATIQLESKTNVWFYSNGLYVTNKIVKPYVDDPRHCLLIGGTDYMWSLNGQYDEIRLRGGTLSADRIKADYDMIAKRDFCTYGKVEAGTGVDPVPPSSRYRVRFNANGGTGTMADEVFEVGVAKSLTANAFTRDGYTFDGWATSVGGAKAYSDKQSVSDLTTTPGATVNLYAVWKEALYMVIDLSGGSSATSYPVSYLGDVPSGGWTDEYKTTKLVLRRMPAGTNSAGGSMSKDMWVGVFEVTQRQVTQIYGTFLKKGNYNGYAYAYLTIGEKYPMIRSLESNVELGETINTRLNSRVSSLNFVIPTKDQWIYACRAGTTTPFNNGTSDEAGLRQVAVCLKKSSYYTAYEDVGARAPNAWGLYDMHGNVSERVGSVTKKDYGVTGIYYYITCMGGWFNCGVDSCKANSEGLQLAYQSFGGDSASGAPQYNCYGYRVFAVAK